LHILLHNLWTRDVGTSGYDKRKWQRLSAYLFALVKAVPEGTLIRIPSD
jgi:hypothetical protein